MAEAWFADMHSIAEMGVMADDSRTGEAITYHGSTNTTFAASKAARNARGLSSIRLSLYSTGRYPEFILLQKGPETSDQAIARQHQISTSS